MQRDGTCCADECRFGALRRLSGSGAGRTGSTNDSDRRAPGRTTITESGRYPIAIVQSRLVHCLVVCAGPRFERASERAWSASAAAGCALSDRTSTGGSQLVHLGREAGEPMDRRRTCACARASREKSRNQALCSVWVHRELSSSLLPGDQLACMARIRRRRSRLLAPCLRRVCISPRLHLAASASRRELVLDVRQKQEVEAIARRPTARASGGGATLSGCCLLQS
jgi:hypothetical protein